jgi:YD repeat-containing protein
LLPISPSAHNHTDEGTRLRPARHIVLFSKIDDSAGNLTTDTYTGAGSRIYDAENRMTKAWGGNNQWQEYAYNADGQRVRRKVDAVETWQVYGFD